MKRSLMLAVFCCAALFGIMPQTSIGHEDESASARDVARNHLVSEAGAAVYNVTSNFRLHRRGSTETIGEVRGTGTAFGVTEGGLVMTAFHLVQGPELTSPAGGATPGPAYTSPGTWTYPSGEVVEGTYILTGRDGTMYIAEIVAIDPENDLAILSIAKGAPGKKFPFIEIERNALRYDSVIAIGSPFGFSFSVTEGIISDPTRKLDDEQKRILVQTNATLHPGNSGGPLVLLRNHRVAGVVIENYSPAPFGIGIAFAVPASVVAKFLDETIRKQQAERKRLP